MASILPVSDLRNYNEVLKNCHKGEPVYLTKNGRGRFVVMDLVDQGLEIISISIDKSNADWLKALDEEQLPWPCLIDTENVFAEKFDGRAIPMFILVDENGIVVEDNLRDQALKNKIEELIRNK